MKIINAIAPIRLNDIGGWTDTWFAGHGAVCNIAVYPYVEVQILVRDRAGDEPQVVVYAENYDLRYQLMPPQSAAAEGLDKLPLIEAAIRRMDIPERLAIEVRVHSEIPPGASTGTSAAVSVAIIGALDRLTPGQMTPYEVARLAHAIETEDLGLQSGVQDQLASAFGGINLVDIHVFPHANVAPVAISNALWWDLEQRLSLIYVGKPHQSSAVHQQVIHDLGPDPSTDPRLERLRILAEQAKDAIFAGDWPAYGAIMDANTEVQRGLHPSLVSPGFERVLAIAGGHGVLGCKVNGAGGDGGSVTVLGDGVMARKRAMHSELASAGFRPVPIYLARQGLRVWDSAYTNAA